VELRPQAVQKYSLQLVMDMPGVADAAASLPITAECAVPLISLAQDDKLLQFGEVFLRHPYSRDFSLVNQSKLPAKFEVLAQVRGGKIQIGSEQPVPHQHNSIMTCTHSRLASPTQIFAIRCRCCQASDY